MLDQTATPLRYAMRALHEFLKLESASSILLLSAGVLALVMKNHAVLTLFYDALLDMPIQIRVGPLDLHKPLLLWINEGLMAIFFFVVSLELKREMLEGHLSHLEQVILPVIAALGGMLVPALIYWFFNYDTPLLRGWAIPTATDIAFSLGVLALLSKQLPISLKLFLMALAIVDDLGAIVIIALFYSGHELHLFPLLLMAAMMVILFTMNIRQVKSVLAYMVVGIALWLCVLKSGLHATLAGVILAFFIPLHIKVSLRKDKLTDDHAYSPLRQLEHYWHPWVAFVILPLFAFANAGISFQGLSLAVLWMPVPLGIAAGLFIGKIVGVYGFTWLAVKLGLATLPKGATALETFGVAALCGIGFTMSLFIGSLAFTDATHLNQVRLGVLLGSSLSAIIGYCILLLTTQIRRMN